MSHIRKLILTGQIRGSEKRVSSYYSWPRGEKQSEVEKIIYKFRKNFYNVSVVLQHNFID